ncbi:MAG: hypothetical protein CM15mP102_18570 [Flavobacteriales bacterium]|nr:MAG: hypothetical protein CM15mP102_18570 [Flavobacteriales bacterium]
MYCTWCSWFSILIIGFATGDDSIKMSAASGDYGVITPIIILSQIVLFIAVIVTLTFL